MAITAADIHFHLSINVGPGNSTAQPNPNDSIGGFLSSTEIVDATLNDLFDVITGDENAASVVDYRCFFVRNSHATITLLNTKVWLFSEVAGGASAAIALDGTGIVDFNAVGAQAERVANELTPPAGEVFTAPTTKAAGLNVGDLAPGKAIAVWVRRTAANTSAVDNDGVTIKVEGDTTA